MDPLTAVAASGLAGPHGIARSAGQQHRQCLHRRLQGRSRVLQPLRRSGSGGGKRPTMPVIERPWTDLSQGVLRDTGNSLDLALSGSGFFAVKGPTGPLYTRNGSFRLSAGGQLVTADGYPVRGADGAPLTAPDGGARRDLERWHHHARTALVAASFKSPISPAPPAWPSRAAIISAPAPARPAAPPAATAVEQGKLEDSNTGTAEAAVRLVSIMRQFEMLQKAVSHGRRNEPAGHRTGGQGGFLRTGRMHRARQTGLRNGRTYDSSTIQRRQRDDGAANQRRQHRQQPGQCQHRRL